jgi:hypothetical protein
MVLTIVKDKHSNRVGMKEFKGFYCPLIELFNEIVICPISVSVLASLDKYSGIVFDPSKGRR